MLRFCWPGCLTVMYDAQEIGLLQIPDIRKNNDYAMWLHVIDKADCYLLPEILAGYRRRSGSISNQSYIKLIKMALQTLSAGSKGIRMSQCCAYGGKLDIRRI